MPTEWREGKEKFERGHIGDDQLLKDTQKYGIFFKDTHVKASPEGRDSVVPLVFGGERNNDWGYWASASALAGAASSFSR